MEPEMIAPITHEGFSMLDLFFQADIVVKTVMVGLLIASFWSWVIIVDKWLDLKRAAKKASAFEETFWSGRPVDEMGEEIGDTPRDAMTRVFATGYREWREVKRQPTLTRAQADAMIERAERAMNTQIGREASAMEKSIGVLASVGSASPFIGLFGTVWGIMNAFEKIGVMQDTSLTVVAPAIAEALFATAMGLFAAIPATIFYNKLSGDVSKLADRLHAFSQDYLVRLSRRLNERAG
jgi:biopolymer transport protein TolQ